MATTVTLDAEIVRAVQRETNEKRNTNDELERLAEC